MGLSCDSEFRHHHVICKEVKHPFVSQMANGDTFRIDHVSVRSHSELIRQFYNRDGFEVKFCVQEDEETPPTGQIEQWELVIFPMYTKGRENVHGSIVGDSIINGNLFIEAGKVTRPSSNYCDNDYEEMQTPVLEFAKRYIEEILERHI